MPSFRAMLSFRERTTRKTFSNLLKRPLEASLRRAPVALDIVQLAVVGGLFILSWLPPILLIEGGTAAVFVWTVEAKIALVWQLSSIGPLLVGLNWAMLLVERAVDGSVTSRHTSAGTETSPPHFATSQGVPRRTSLLQNLSDIGHGKQLHIGAARHLLAVTVILFQLQEVAAHVIAPDLVDVVVGKLNDYLSLVLLGAWCGLLNSSFAKLDQAARHADEQLSHPVISKWRDLLVHFTASGNPKKDALWCYANDSSPRRTAARVLTEMAAVYIAMGKLVGFALVILHFLGVDLYQNIVFISVSLLGSRVIHGPVPVAVPSLAASLHGKLGTLLSSALYLREAVRNLAAIALSKPFHVGEIISLSRPGFTPADMPTNHLAGFVEAITWGHIVVRDFKKKQTFVPHSEFVHLVVSNWTRRPNKLCRYELKLSPRGREPAARVAALARFARDWIRAHPNVEQAGYQKSVLRGLQAGLHLEVIFYPKVGVNVYQLRTEFIVALMDAATALRLDVIADELITPFDPPGSTGATSGAADGAPAYVGGEGEQGTGGGQGIELVLQGLLPSSVDPAARAQRAGWH